MSRSTDNRDMAEIEKELRYRIEALEAKVHELENENMRLADELATAQDVPPVW